MDKKYDYHIGKRIQYFREKKNISVNKLANDAGVSQSYLRDIELDNKNPTIGFLALLCDALGITIRDFFDDDFLPHASEDPLIQRIYQLSPEQKKELLSFLNTVK